jgi:hypothetical protein
VTRFKNAKFEEAGRHHDWAWARLLAGIATVGLLVYLTCPATPPSGSVKAFFKSLAGEVVCSA